MGKIWVGIAGALGVLVGILIAPRKGSETREQIVHKSEPLQQAARSAFSKAGDATRNAASKAGDVVKPVTRAVGERVPLLDRANGSGKLEDPAEEAGGETRVDGETAARRAKAGRVAGRN